MTETHGRTLTHSLRQLCRDSDEGRPLRRVLLSGAVAPALIGLSLSLGGCPEPTAALYAAPSELTGTELRCGDGVDNDHDGAVDCSDSDCLEDAICAPVPEYMAPLPELETAPTPGDRAPNDDDGSAEPAVTMYGAPIPS